MTITDSPDPAKTGQLAQQIVAILSNEDSVTRQRAVQAAMMLMGEALPKTGKSRPELDDGEASDDENGDLASFFDREGEMKPADYAYLCAAYHFSQFGTAPFSIAEIRAVALEAGVVVPDRLDMTFAAATKKGKKLFQSPGKGSFKPTASGSVEFGQRWGGQARPEGKGRSDHNG